MHGVVEIDHVQCATLTQTSKITRNMVFNKNVIAKVNQNARNNILELSP